MQENTCDSTSDISFVMQITHARHSRISNSRLYYRFVNSYGRISDCLRILPMWLARNHISGQASLNANFAQRHHQYE